MAYKSRRIFGGGKGGSNPGHLHLFVFCALWRIDNCFLGTLLGYVHTAFFWRILDAFSVAKKCPSCRKRFLTHFF